MSFLSDALNTLKKGLKEVEDKVNEAVQASKENEKVSGEKPAGAVIGGGVPSGTIIGGGSAVPAGEYHERSWYEEVPSEECQYNFGGSYLDYFTKIFREDFPEYDVGLETVESGRRYKYTLRKAGDVSLVVELMTEKSEANKLRRDTLRAGIPYTRFYFDHYGWWNTRKYVVDRVKNALRD